jgi:hypothetical protein
VVRGVRHVVLDPNPVVDDGGVVWSGQRRDDGFGGLARTLTTREGTTH